MRLQRRNETLLIDPGATTPDELADALRALEDMPRFAILDARGLSADAVERLLGEWGFVALAVLVLEDSAADRVERASRQLATKVRPCSSEPEAERWLAHVAAVRAPAPEAVTSPAAPRPPPPARCLPRTVSPELIEASLALLRSPELGPGGFGCKVAGAGDALHFRAFEGRLGYVPFDVRRVLERTMGIRTPVGDLWLDATESPVGVTPDAFGPLLPLCEGEGVFLEPDPQHCRLWWLEHDGLPLTLLERSVDAWLVRCAHLAFSGSGPGQAPGPEIRATLPMQLVDLRAGSLHTLLSSLDSNPYSVEAHPIEAWSEGASLDAQEMAWIRSLPASARVLDFRSALPGSRAELDWTDGEWSHFRELWACY